MSRAEVSVIVATYRRDKELKQALASLKEQSIAEMEIIVVNDNDDIEWKEKAAEAVKEFKRNSPSISLIYIENENNLGSAQARNVGIKAACGEYITFLDDDDVYLKQKAEQQVRFMRDGGFDYSITDLELIDKNGKTVDIRTRKYIEDTSKEALLNYHLKYHMTGTDTMMFKRDYIMKIGCFAPIDVGDEFYLMQRAIEGGGSFGYLKRCDVRAVVHVGEESLSSGAKKIKGENRLYEYKKRFFENMDGGTIRYIKVRHHAVLAYAYFRDGKYIRAFAQAVCAFFVSPMQCFKIISER